MRTAKQYVRSAGISFRNPQSAIRDLTLVCFLGLGTGFASFIAPPPSPELDRLMSANGFDRVSLERRFGNHLWTHATVNGRPARLVVDSSAPVTLVHRASAETYRLALTPTNEPVLEMVGATGAYSRGSVHSLRIGSRVFVDLPVRVAPEAVWLSPPEYLIVAKLKPNAKRYKLSSGVRVDPVNGLLGVDVLRATGAVMDCGHQKLYLSAQPNPAASEHLASFLLGRGFARIPLRIRGDGKLEVNAAINDESTRLLVATGSSFSFISHSVARAAHIFSTPLRFVYPVRAEAIAAIPISHGTAKSFRVGDFTAPDTDLTIASMNRGFLHGADGVLGIEFLSHHYAVLDFASLTLWLRQPEHR